MSHIRAPWTNLEDETLTALVKDPNFEGQWSSIATQLNFVCGSRRCGKQARQRWNNVLNPEVAHDSWTEEEDRIMREVQKRIGNKWVDIARHLPGRSDAQVKNHWYSSQRRLERIYKKETVKSSDVTGTDETLVESREGFEIGIKRCVYVPAWGSQGAGENKSSRGSRRGVAKAAHSVESSSHTPSILEQLSSSSDSLDARASGHGGTSGWASGKRRREVNLDGPEMPPTDPRVFRERVSPGSHFQSLAPAPHTHFSQHSRPWPPAYSLHLDTKTPALEPPLSSGTSPAYVGNATLYNSLSNVLEGLNPLGVIAMSLPNSPVDSTFPSSCAPPLGPSSKDGPVRALPDSISVGGGRGTSFSFEGFQLAAVSNPYLHAAALSNPGMMSPWVSSGGVARYFTFPTTAHSAGRG